MQAGRNFGRDIPMDYFRGLMDMKPLSTPDLPVKYHDTENVVVPENFDGREYWSNCPSLKEIRDQGACHASWVSQSPTVCLNIINNKC